MISYSTAHRRVREHYGKASTYPCLHCAAPAREWAYDHLDPSVLRCPRKGSEYSADVSHYWPLCHPCHMRYDYEHGTRT